jgi:hypothetical protein
MKILIVSAAAIAAATMFIPTPSSAQIGLQGPGFGVQIGGSPYYGGGYSYREPSYGYRAYEYDEPVVVQRRVYSGYDEPVVRRRVYRQRYVSMQGCRTVTVQRRDGLIRRIRRCG